MNYSELSQETQTFLNKAMDIYSLKKDKSIIRSIFFMFGREEYELTKLDKKVLTLFIAGFLVDGNLKKILSQYDDIKINELFYWLLLEKNLKL